MDLQLIEDKNTDYIGRHCCSDRPPFSKREKKRNTSCKRDQGVYAGYGWVADTDTRIIENFVVTVQIEST